MQEKTPGTGDRNATTVEQPLSVSHLCGDHLRVDSTLRCKAIPSEELKDVDTEEKRKKWTSAAISNCKLTSVAHPKFQMCVHGGHIFHNRGTPR